MSRIPTPSTGLLIRLLPATTFVLGLIIGGLFVGLGSFGQDAQSRPGISGDGVTGPTGQTPTTTGTAIVIPEACSGAATAVNEALRLLRTGAGAVRDFQPKILVQVLDDLEVLDPKLRRLADQCSAVDVAPATGPSSSGPATSTPSR